MRGIEDTAFTGVVSISTTLGRYFVKGDLSLTSIAGSGRRMVFSVEGGTTEVNCLVFMGSSFRRRRKDVCGGLQLRGATEWDEPGTFIFEWCCQRCGPRPPHGPAAGPAIRPQPGRVSPGVTRRPRAVRSGRPSEGGEAEVPQRIGDLQDIVRTNRAGQGRFAEPPAADDPVARMQPDCRQGAEA